MKGGQAWDNNNSVPVPDVPCSGRHGSSGWKMSRCDRLPDWPQDVDVRINYAIEYAKKNQFLHSRDAVIVVTGWRKGAGATNTMRVVYVE